MSQEINLLKKGQFYFIYDGSGQNFVVEDKTKRGLPVVENNIDDNIGVITDKGRFYDANGRGHVVPIRWYFPKENYTLQYFPFPSFSSLSYSWKNCVNHWKRRHMM